MEKRIKKLGTYNPGKNMCTKTSEIRQEQKTLISAFL